MHSTRPCAAVQAWYPLILARGSRLTCEAGGAEAEEGSREIKAAGTQGAWAAQTLIHLRLAAQACEAWGTGHRAQGMLRGCGHLPCPRSPSASEPRLPGRHSQRKDPGWSWHCPPLAQGELPHSLTSSSHQEPVNPAGWRGVGRGRHLCSLHASGSLLQSWLSLASTISWVKAEMKFTLTAALHAQGGRCHRWKGGRGAGRASQCKAPIEGFLVI